MRGIPWMNLKLLTGRLLANQVRATATELSRGGVQGFLAIWRRRHHSISDRAPRNSAGAFDLCRIRRAGLFRIQHALSAVERQLARSRHGRRQGQHREHDGARHVLAPRSHGAVPMDRPRQYQHDPAGERLFGPIGILSIDIDGNDYWVWQRIEAVEPVIVIAEYNSVFGARQAITVPV